MLAIGHGVSGFMQFLVFVFSTKFCKKKETEASTGPGPAKHFLPFPTSQRNPTPVTFPSENVISQQPRLLAIVVGSHITSLSCCSTTMDLVSYHNQAIRLLLTASDGATGAAQWNLGLEILHQVTRHLTVELARACSVVSSDQNNNQGRMMLEPCDPQIATTSLVQVRRVSFRRREEQQVQPRSSRTSNDVGEEETCFEHLFLMETTPIEAILLGCPWGRRQNSPSTSDDINTIVKLSQLATSCLAVCLYNEAVVRHVQYQRKSHWEVMDEGRAKEREQEDDNLSTIASRYESAITLLTDIVPCFSSTPCSSLLENSSSSLPMIVLAAATNLIHVALEQGDLDKARHWTRRLRSPQYLDCVGIQLESHLFWSWWHDHHHERQSSSSASTAEGLARHYSETVYALSTIQVMSSVHDFCAARAA